MHNVAGRAWTWLLVLAAGDGSRLRELTTTGSGIAVPKQFCSLRGGPSLLQQALSRAQAVVELPHLCTVVAAQHRRWWERPLATLEARNVIVQPANRGTANGILLPLLHILERDPAARIMVLPSDHHVRDEATLPESMRQAALHLTPRSTEILLLGIAPEEADPGFGYILPGAPAGDCSRRVHRFIEKPTARVASLLIEQGALWNAFILAARGEALLRLFRRSFPELVTTMRAAVRHDLAQCPPAPNATVALYERLPVLDFSRDVLPGQEGSLRVWPVPPCGWSDLGTRERVVQTLRRLPTGGRRDAAAFAESAHLDLAAQHERLQRGA